MKLKLFAAASIAVAASLIACSSSDSGKAPTEHANAVYHWKNTFNPTETEVSFLKKHNVDRIYMRFFDVTCNPRVGAVPSADVSIHSNNIDLSNMEVVPTVFVTLEALQEASPREDELAYKIYRRIKDMMAAHDILNVKEVQIDCDWTNTTRASFDKLCRELRSNFNNDGIELSATIRLHQLMQEPPYADRGVLMVYNVGNLKDPAETNSILRADEVKKYTDKAPSYKLPLDVAYPVFSWGVVFDNDRFSRLTEINAPIDSIKSLKHISDNWYSTGTASEYNWDDPQLSYYEKLRYEFVPADEILKAKEYVERYLGYKPRHTILYHFDEEQYSKYTPDEIDRIYE